MFIIKYHKPKCKTKYHSDKGLASSKSAALAYGESFRAEAEQTFKDKDFVSLVTLDVSRVADMMYCDRVVKVGKIDY